MLYVIGIDSGATSSDVVLFPLEYGKAKEVRKKYEPINISILGIIESARRLVDIIKDISKKTGLSNITAVAAGISGARYEKDRRYLSAIIKKRCGIKNVSVYPDTEIAFASAFENNAENCGILIAGTGSILYYRDDNRKIIKIGGWGRYIGDEGSGYWIAREALYKVTKYYDGRERKTSLAVILENEFGFDKNNIVKKVYHEGFDISKITKYVFDAAEKGDKISRDIILSAAKNLLSHFLPLKKRKSKIALMGSLFTEEVLLEKYLRKLVKESCGNIELIKPGTKPVYGAVKLAVLNIN